MKKTTLAIFCLALAAGLPLAGQQKVSPGPREYKIEQPVTKQEARKAIIKGAVKLGWQPKDDGEGQIEAALKVRGHQVAISIPYAEDGYKFIYKSSVNMRYQEKPYKGIHSKYATWLKNLDAAIQGELALSAAIVEALEMP